MNGAKPTPGSASVLIVDDSAFMRRLMVAALAPLAVDIRQAENGPQALELVAAQPVDLIITDLNMPNMTGIELIEHVRMSSRCPSCAAFVVTPSPTPDFLAQGRQVGVSAWIIKPINPVHIRLAASRILGIESHTSNPAPSRLSEVSPPIPSSVPLNAVDFTDAEVLRATIRRTLHIITECKDNGKPPPASLIAELRAACRDFDHS